MILDKQLARIAKDATPSEILKAASLDWTVEKCPRYFKVGDNFKQVPGKYSLIRTDKAVELDSCTKRWHPQQNIEIVTLAYEALKAQNIDISYAGMLRGGKSIALVANWKETNIGAASVGDVVEAKIMVIGSHQVGVGHQIRMFLNRLVCLNGMTIPIKMGSKVIGHTKKAIETIKQSLETAESTFRNFKATGDRLSQTNISYQEAQAMLIKEFGEPTKSIAEQPSMVQIVLNLFDGKARGSDMLTAYQTAWGLLNSLTEYYSYSQYSRSSDRLHSLAQGSAHNKTRQLQNALLGYAERREVNLSVRQTVSV